MRLVVELLAYDLLELSVLLYYSRQHVPMARTARAESGSVPTAKASRLS